MASHQKSMDNHERPTDTHQKSMDNHQNLWIITKKPMGSHQKSMDNNLKPKISDQKPMGSPQKPIGNAPLMKKSLFAIVEDLMAPKDVWDAHSGSL